MRSQNNIKHIEIFVESLISERALSKNTINSYINDLKGLLYFLKDRDLSFLEVKRVDIEAYIVKLSIDGISASSISRKLSCFRELFRFLISENVIKSNPALDVDHPKKSQNLPKSLSKEQINILFEAAAKLTNDTGIRDYAILQILYSSGMRISEVTNLKLKELSKPIEESDGNKVYAIKGKGEKERLVIFNPIASDALANYLKVRKLSDKSKSIYLFPSPKSSAKDMPMSRQIFFMNLKKLADLCNIDSTLVSPHKIRHSFASHILQNGANLRIVQELMGHADISSTQIYTKVLNSQAKELVLESHPLAQKFAS